MKVPCERYCVESMLGNVVVRLDDDIHFVGTHTAFSHKGATKPLFLNVVTVKVWQSWKVQLLFDVWKALRFSCVNLCCSFFNCAISATKSFIS